MQLYEIFKEKMIILESSRNSESPLDVRFDDTKHCQVPSE